MSEVAMAQEWLRRLLFAQVAPVKPGRQAQSNELPLAVHCPPFSHGLLKQGSPNIKKIHNNTKSTCTVKFTSNILRMLQR